MTVDRAAANKQALKRMLQCDPVLVDVRPAGEVVPGMGKRTILTSGAELPWSEITGTQRRTIINGAIFEGLAASEEEAAAQLDAGTIAVEPTQPHGCVGMSTGVYTASMPVFVVEGRTSGNQGFCQLAEGNPPRLFVNGAWGDDVVQRMRFAADVLAPITAAAVRRAGGIPLKPIIRRAIGMGDDLHTRNDAGTQLFFGALFPALLDVAREHDADVRKVIQFYQTTPFAFLRVGCPAAKVAVDAAQGVEGSSLVTGMIHSVKDFAIRVSGLGEEWFRGPHPEFLGDYFWGSSAADVGWAGGESTVMETIGLGGFCQAAAFGLPFRGSVDKMIERNLQMYEITAGEDQELKIPYFDRGAPVGIDVLKVVETGIRPVINGVVVRRDGEGAAGIGPLVTSMEPFQAAAEAYRRRYG